MIQNYIDLEFMLDHPCDIYTINFCVGRSAGYLINNITLEATPRKAPVFGGVPFFVNVLPRIIFMALDISKNGSKHVAGIMTPTIEYTLMQATHPLIGVIKYNKLLSIVEDALDVSIEEFTQGVFHYLE
jgi:hypothetical protein